MCKLFSAFARVFARVIYINYRTKILLKRVFTTKKNKIYVNGIHFRVYYYIENLLNQKLNKQC